MALNPALFVSSFALILILFIRVTSGIDLSDEMQYYGEIKGLIETGRLFSNDLFIQQSVYILLYPLFYLYHLAFGFDGLVFFGRLIMVFLTLAVFFYAYRKLTELNLSTLAASLTAFSLCFAIPYHGVFAPSYNTVSQALWVVFALNYLKWKPKNEIVLGLLPIIMFFAHPTSAVTMMLFILARLLIDREFYRARTILSASLGGALFAIPVALSFANPQQYLSSIAFSSGYGVGTVFFSNGTQQSILFGIFALFIISFLFRGTFSRVRFAFPLLTPVLSVIAVVMSLEGLSGGAYSKGVVKLLALASAIAYAWALSSISQQEEGQRALNWFVALLLGYAATLGITSGNGVGQATGAFMVGLPLLMGLAVTYAANNPGKNQNRLLFNTNVILVCALLITHWAQNPYREDVWWRANQPLSFVNEFRLIKSTPERAAFIQQLQTYLNPIVKGKRMLLVSEYPALYLALDGQAETCMLYMHSLTSDKSERVLLDCLNKKTPDVIVDILSNKNIAADGSRIKKALQTYYSQHGFECTSKSITTATRRNVEENIRISVCLIGI